MIENNTIKYLKRRIEELEIVVADVEEELRSNAREREGLWLTIKSGRKKLVAEKRQLAAYKKVLKDSEPPEEKS